MERDLQADVLERGRRAPDPLRFRDAGEGKGQRDVLPGAERRDEAERLEDEAEPALPETCSLGG